MELNKAFRELDVETQDALDVSARARGSAGASSTKWVSPTVGRSSTSMSRFRAGVLAPSDVANAVRAFDDRYAAIYGVGAAAPRMATT